nr:hypothetical protein [Acetobacter persici]
MRKLPRFYPRTIYGQMVTLVSVCMFLTLSITPFLLYAFRPLVPPLPGGPWTNILAIETGIEALQAAPPQFREQLPRRFPATGSILVSAPHQPVPSCQQTP